MTLIAVSIAVHAADQVGRALERAAAARLRGADLIEWRIDELVADERDALPATRRLVRECPLPCIVTCRLAAEAGPPGGDPQEGSAGYHGDEQVRISLMEALGSAADLAERPRFIDVELAAIESSANLRQKVLLSVQHPAQPRDLSTSLIISSHDFGGRPADLIQRILRMTEHARQSGGVMKLAWMARSLRDNLEAFELLRARTGPMIALCMGRFGLPSRVLAPKFGGFLTYAGDHEAEVTAPGQPVIEDLKKKYRFDRIGPQTKVYGVIGWPVEHSKGPTIHNAGFEAVGHDGVYLPMPIPPEYEHFKATVGAMIDFGPLDFRGASVTLPHKENLLRFVRGRGGRTDPLTERIGAANTLVVGSAGGLECSNTDSPAAVEALCGGMGIQRPELTGKRIAVIGAGGVARAVIVGLCDAGATVVVFSRNQERARKLVEELGVGGTGVSPVADSPEIRVPGDGCHAVAAGVASACETPDAVDTSNMPMLREGMAPGKLAVGKPGSLACGCFHVFINCTPVGMEGGPEPDSSPLPDDVKLDDSITVMDTVYTPARTPLIREAESRGARIITGVDMFIRQAAMQFEKWTGKAMPRETADEAVR